MKLAATLPFLLAGALGAASAETIRVQEVCGFSFAPCGQIATPAVLEEGGPTLDYYTDESGQFVFTLAFVEGSFVMEALRDNTVAASGGLPFGLIGWPPSGPMIPPIGGEASNNELFFISWMNFPDVAGEQLVVALPAVDEVPTPALLLLGLGAIAFGRRYRFTSVR